jgi:ABC-type molybdate transport system permease subunit
LQINKATIALTSKEAACLAKIIKKEEERLQIPSEPFHILPLFLPPEVTYNTVTFLFNDNMPMCGWKTPADQELKIGRRSWCV